MKRTAIALCATLIALAVSGCSTSAGNPDEAYLSAVRETAPELAGTPEDDAELIRLGKQMCDLFDQYGYETAYERVVTGATNPTQASVVAGAAVGAYCPEFSEEMG